MIGLGTDFQWSPDTSHTTPKHPTSTFNCLVPNAALTFTLELCRRAQASHSVLGETKMAFTCVLRVLCLT